jgi:hypothetical protein
MAMRALLLVGAAIGASAVVVRSTDSDNLLENPSFAEPGDGPRTPARGWVANVTQFRRAGGNVLRFDGAAAGEHCTVHERAHAHARHPLMMFSHACRSLPEGLLCHSCYHYIVALSSVATLALSLCDTVRTIEAQLTVNEHVCK